MKNPALATSDGSIQGTLFRMMLIIIGFIVLAVLVGIAVAFIDWRGEKEDSGQ